MADQADSTARRDSVMSRTDNPRYDRGIINGLGPFIDGKADGAAAGLYTDQEISQLVRLRGTDRDVEARMPVKITAHYLDMARDSRPLQTLVKADHGPLPRHGTRQQAPADPGESQP